MTNTLRSGPQRIKRPVYLNSNNWRSLIPVTTYEAIHAARFRGANRLRTLFDLQRIDIENWVSKVIVSVTSPGSAFVDVGAQRGRHSAALLEMGPNDTFVVAVEANPELIDPLKERFLKYGTRIQVVSTALGDSEGKEVPFYVNAADSGYSGLQPRAIKAVSDNWVQVPVKQTNLDSLQVARPISCIKMDVEGAELKVLMGGQKSIKRDRPVVLFECASNASKYYGYDLGRLATWFTELQYELYTITGYQIDSLAEAERIYSNRLCHDFVACPREKSSSIVDTLTHITHG